MRIESCRLDDLEDWTALRGALWPQGASRELRLEAEDLLRSPRAIAFIARTDDRTPAGFVEATLRRDYVNGCTSSPVAFIEGIYVCPPHRRAGVARHLCQAVENWARTLGCTELASDTELHNTVSQRMHAALGFDETERVVYCRKPLTGQA